MATKTQKPSVNDQLPPDSPVTPARIGFGHPEYNFVQSIMEMQKSLGEINASLISMNKSIESTKTKVEDLVSWKHKILGGAFVFGVVATLIGGLIGWGWKYVTIQNPSAQTQQASPSIVQSIPGKQR